MYKVGPEEPLPLPTMNFGDEASDTARSNYVGQGEVSSRNQQEQPLPLPTMNFSDRYKPPAPARPRGPKLVRPGHAEKPLPLPAWE